MSIINKMLEDLDRREGMADPDTVSAMPHVRIAPPFRKNREWFWRIIAGLMVASVGCVAWIAWQLQPRAPLVTEQAFKALESAKRDSAPVAAAPKPVPDQPAPQQALKAAESAKRDPAPVAAAPKPVPDQPSPAAKPAPESIATFQMAPVIENPIAAQTQKPAPREERKQAAVPKSAPAAQPGATAAKLGLDVPPARKLQPPAQTPARVEKLDRARSANDRAEAEFRRAAALLNQGQVAEAEEGFGAALTANPGHESTRQALIALHLEHRRIDDARRLLQEGIALNPANLRFAAVLARIFLERKDYGAALEVLDRVRRSAPDNSELQAIRGTVHQRLGRHSEAAEAFQMSLRNAPQIGATWMGLGISLESLGNRVEASEAFKRAASAGTLGPEARAYAEQRSRQLQ